MRGILLSAVVACCAGSQAYAQARDLYPWQLPPAALASMQRILPRTYKDVEWIYQLKGVGSEVLNVTIAGKPYWSGAVCKPHDCADNRLAFLAAADGSRAVAGLMLQAKNMQTFGSPTAAETAIFKRDFDRGRAGGPWLKPDEERAAQQKMLD